MLKRAHYALLVTAVATSMSACVMNPYIDPPRPAVLSHQAAAGGFLGGVYGAVAGVATSGSVAGTAAGGAFIGVVAGAKHVSTHVLMARLQAYGVQVIQIGETLRIIIPSDHLFEFDSAQISVNNYPVINTVVALLYRYGNVPITITGFTDDVQQASHNLLLSQQQAKVVAGYLWAHGIRYYNVSPVGDGAANAIASNDNPVGSFFNRRVELTLPVVPCAVQAHEQPQE